LILRDVNGAGTFVEAFFFVGMSHLLSCVKITLVQVPNGYFLQSETILIVVGVQEADPSLRSG